MGLIVVGLGISELIRTTLVLRMAFVPVPWKAPV
jgi:hypothetical protein